MSETRTSITLPGAVGRMADGMTDAMLKPPGGFRVDFTQPAGEAALIGADSVSWRLFKNPVSLFIGGVTAVLLEFAEPRVRDGVWHNSTFRSDPLGRLKRTGLAAMVTVYGARSVAEKMIAGVVRMHERVRGTTSGGEAYHANDVALLDWVQATATFGFMEAYHAFVRPLSGAERDAAYAEAGAAARLYGAVGAPDSAAGFDALMTRMSARFEPSPIVEEFLEIMLRVKALPGIARPLQRMMVRAAVEILPETVRARLGLGRRWKLGAIERRLVTGAGRLADRIVLRASPAVQACRRLGLPDDHLYRRR